MDTKSPIYARRWTSEPTNTNNAARPTDSRTASAALLDSPTMRGGGHARTASAAGISNVKRTQNFAARAAAQRLAQVMASQTTDEDDDEDYYAADLSFRYASPTPALSGNNVNTDNARPKPVLPSSASAKTTTPTSSSSPPAVSNEFRSVSSCTVRSALILLALSSLGIFSAKSPSNSLLPGLYNLSID